MAILDTLKDAVGLIQKVDNIELYRKILDLQGQVFALVEENRALQQQLATKDDLTFRENAYWMNAGAGGTEGPYCSQCWDADGKLVRIHKRPGYHPECPRCRVGIGGHGPAIA